MLNRWSQQRKVVTKIISHTACRQVARLVIESHQLNVLDKPLRELFSGKVSSIFVEAAEQARTRGNADVAANLFFRAGRHDLLLSLLNYQLSAEMVGGLEHACVES